MKDLNEERRLTLTAASENQERLDLLVYQITGILKEYGLDVDWSITVATEREEPAKDED